MPKQYGTTGPRALWPSVATSRPLARCSVEAQLLFDRLLVSADDQGRLQGDPLLVKAACMPLMPAATPEAIDGWLAELTAQGLIIRYDAGDQPLIQVRGWWDHQGGARHAYPSRWPCPPDWPDDVLKGHGMEGTGGPPGADGGQRPPRAGAGASASTNTSAGAPTPGPESAPPVDAQAVYREVTGRKPGKKQRDWIGDLCNERGIAAVVAAMRADAEPKQEGLLRRITDRLRTPRIEPAPLHDGRHGSACSVCAPLLIAYAEGE